MTPLTERAIDIHCHVLPGVDDGPATWEQSLTMVRAAAAEGIDTIVATSHMMPDGPWANTRTRLLPLVGELQRRVENAGLAVTIVAGGEVYMTPDVVERFERGDVLTYGDAGHYALLEMPAMEMPRYTPDVLFELKLRGITPIIAHPERNADIVRRPMRAQQLIQSGALLQINVASLRRGHRVRSVARFLLQQGFVHFLATDAHGPSVRPPRWQPYLQQAVRWVGTSTVRRLVYDNPLAMLKGLSATPATAPATTPATAPATTPATAPGARRKNVWPVLH